MKAISGSHVLLTNLIIAWNTKKVSEVVARMRSGADVSDDIVRRIGPVFFGNINFRGTMRFSIDKYAGILLAKVEDGAHVKVKRQHA